jgi:hypothetical protein
MNTVLNSLDEIQKRAYELYTMSKSPSEWFKSNDSDDMPPNARPPTTDSSIDDDDDEDVKDLIDLKLRA